MQYRKVVSVLLKPAIKASLLLLGLASAGLAQTTHTITASAGPGGSINPSGDVIVVEGADQSFIIAPDVGYQVADVVVDGGSVGAVLDYTFTNVTSDHTIAASFAANAPEFITDIAALDVPEGGTANFQVKLSAQPAGDVAVTVAWFAGDADISVQSGAGLTFNTSNWDTFQVVTLAAAEDVDVQNSPATIRISAAGVPDKNVTATEQDNDTLTFVTDVDSVNVPEGGTANFQVKLSAQPAEDAAVTVAWFAGDADISVQSGASLTFDNSNWDTFQVVTLAAAEDVDVQNSPATIRISAAGVPDKNVTATEQDNDTLTFVTDLDSVNVLEGGTANFQVKLSAQPAGDVAVTVAWLAGDADISVQSGASLNFDTSNWDTFQVVTLAAAEDPDVTNDPATIRVSAAGIPDKNVTATEQDNDTLQFVTNADTISIPEGNTETLQVRLSAKPSGNVSVTVVRASGDPDITVQAGSSLTFHPSNWDTFQVVTLAAAEDVDVQNSAATIRISAEGVPDKNVTATEQDNDTLTFVTDQDSVNVPEGGTANFQVRLSAQPAGDVDVTVARLAGDVDISVQSGANLIFNTLNWDTFQVVTLAAAEDVDIQNGTATVRTSAAGVPEKNVTAAEQDNDTLTFVTDLDSVNVPEGGTANFQVKLSAEPAEDVAVTVAWLAGDGDVSVQSGASPTFNTLNWDTFQVVTLAAAEDVDIQNGTATLRINAIGLPNKDITAAEQDNDTLQIVTNSDLIDVPEGATAVLQVRLSAKPNGNVDIAVTRASGDTDIAVQSGASLTFNPSNWDTYQDVTLGAAEDVDTQNGTATIRLSAAEVPNKDVTATELDNDTLAVVTDLTALDVPEGGTANLQARLSNQPSGPVSVTVARAGGDTDITIQSASTLDFNAANWNVYQTVTLAAAEDVDTQNGTATIQLSAAEVPNKDVTATELDNDTLAVVTDLTSVNVPENGTATFQVRLSAQPPASVVVSASRASGDTDITVQSGAALTFTASNWSVYQTVTLAAAEDVDTQNGTATIRLSAAGLANKDVTATEQDNDSLNLLTDLTTVNVPEGGTAVFRVRLSAQPPASVTVSVIRLSGDTSITVQSGSSLNFSSANWSVYQPVTLAAAEDADSSNGTATIRVSAPGFSPADVTAVEQDDDADNGTIAPVLTPSLSTSGLTLDTTVEISGNKSSLAAIGFDLIFDSAVFTYTGFEPGSLTGDWSITADTSVAGRVRVRGSGGLVIPVSSSGSLAKISFRVNCLSYTVPTISVLRLENYTDGLYDEFLPLPSTANFTFYPCARLGDVNNDGNVTPGDAQMAFEIYLGKVNPTFCQSAAADGNCSGTTTPGDAQEIFEHYLGKKSLPQCCAEAAAQVSLALGNPVLTVEETPDASPARGGRSSRAARSPAEPQPRSRRPEMSRRLFALDSLGQPGETVNIPILISDPSGLTAFGFDVLYPRDVLEYLGARKTILSEDYDLLSGVEESPGLIHVEGRNEKPIDDEELGALVLLMFLVKEGDDLSLPVEVLNPSQDLRDARNGAGTFLRRNGPLDVSRLVGLGTPLPKAENLWRVPVQVNDLFGLKAFGFELSYPVDKLVFLGIRHPEAAAGWIALQSWETRPGLVKVGSYRMDPILVREPGCLVELVFQVVGRGGEVCLSGLVDDLAEALVTTGKITLE